MKRRDTLRLGCLSAFGFSIVDYLRLRACGAVAISAQAKSCILIWLDGGPSHLEMFDPKPDVPLEVRGPFSTTATRIPGVAFGEHLARTADIADQLTILRSLTSPLGEHGLANTYMLTGYKPSPVLEYPSLGSVLAHQRPTTRLPSFISIPDTRGGQAGFLDRRCAPFATGGDPSKSDFQVRDLRPHPEITDLRLRRRREFLQQLDVVRRSSDDGQLDSLDPAMRQAFDLVLSPESVAAFDLQAESESTRQRYGTRMLGQSCLLARRLVERGVPFVSVVNTGWDTHSDLVLQLRDGFAGAKQGVGLIPTFDQAFSALISDLKDRGLLDQTLVVAMGEFGRTPKLNPRGGRDHWPGVFSVALAGGGVAAGKVIGRSDATGESPLDQPITPSDLAYTIYSLLGIDPGKTLITPDGRPVTINRDGQMIVGITS